MRNRRGLIIGGLLLVAASSMAAWWWTRPEPEDPQIARVEQIGRQLTDLPPGVESIDRAQELMGEIRGEMGQMSPEQRRELMERGRSQMFQMMQRRIDKYFELPEEDRQAHLDAEIDMMEQMRQRFASRRNEARGEGGGESGGEGGRGQGWGGGGGGPRGEGFNPERRREFQQNFLNNTTADQRGRMTRYMEDMQQRRTERGLPGFPGGPF